jgi:hypothetical protein
MRTLIAAAAAALSLAAAPVAAQPDPSSGPERQEEARDGNMKGELWGYLALPVLIVIILLIAVAAGDEEPKSP